MVKERKLTVSMNGNEIYTETQNIETNLKNCISEYQERFSGLKTAMPSAEFYITVQDPWHDKNDEVNHQLLDVESGKFEIDEIG